MGPRGQADAAQALFAGFCFLRLCLRRKLSPFISRIWTWWVRRSSNAPVRRSEPKTSVHSSNGRLDRGHQDRATLVALAEHLEQQLGAGLGERHETQLVDDEELEVGELLLEPQQLSVIARLHELVDQGGGGGKADRQVSSGRRQGRGRAQCDSCRCRNCPERSHSPGARCTRIVPARGPAPC